MYHCFGCGEGGDVFKFLMTIDHVTFTEAVERLAQRLGYELHYEDGKGQQEQGNRARLLAANKAAEAFFIAQLSTPEAQPGRDFLGGRGFDREAAARFGVGFAPKGGALGRHLRTLGFAEDELVASGLLGPRRARRRVRPLPLAARLADPRHDRADARLRRAAPPRRGPGAEVPQHA